MAMASRPMEMFAEASGDSEMVSWDMHNVNMEYDDDDDNESCVCGGTHDAYGDGEEEEEEVESEDLSTTVKMGYEWFKEDEMEEGEADSNGVSRREKDKLFWEFCLASGFP